MAEAVAEEEAALAKGKVGAEAGGRRSQPYNIWQGAHSPAPELTPTGTSQLRRWQTPRADNKRKRWPQGQEREEAREKVAARGRVQAKETARATAISGWRRALPPNQLPVRSLPLTHSRGCPQPTAASGKPGCVSQWTTTPNPRPSRPQGGRRLSEATTAYRSPPPRPQRHPSWRLRSLAFPHPMECGQLQLGATQTTGWCHIQRWQ